ncbi:hypothetical protein [Sphingomonas lacusdianchii]|uniref:hypothetical protein n=1 Tax=Sphingomonas lacusdianchii TaxID=2917992 RepID=UPI001F58F757|nr:hypothetical protein [Sphingomonas sp. JXJ CY 53]
MKKTFQRTVRFDRDQAARLEAIAVNHNRTFADQLRIVLTEWLEGQNILNASQLRQARVAEYAQAALDTIILENHPEFRDRIVAETDRRMERYHGAR